MPDEEISYDGVDVRASSGDDRVVAASAVSSMKPYFCRVAVARCAVDRDGLTVGSQAPNGAFRARRSFTRARSERNFVEYPQLPRTVCKEKLLRNRIGTYERPEVEAGHLRNFAHRNLKSLCFGS